ncbi:MAG: RHS repeat-associated core domain-containing protein [Flavobacteriales bacterium]|nr:RHS repeat-associated core domain-containing protein [Flavobacteriales bacterium]
MELKRNGFAASRLSMDDLEYHYIPNTNKLHRVEDRFAEPSQNPPYLYADIKDGQNANNYHYDQTGNLIKDIQEGIDAIEWNVSGKISKITRTPGSGHADLEFKYDASGNRVSKTVKPAGSTSSGWITTYYIRDAQGNILTTYEKKENNTSLYLSEFHIFGSTRMGLLKVDKKIADLNTGNFKNRLIGRKNFELSKHLGNVLSVVSDRKISVTLNTTMVAYYMAEIKSATDYYAFGSIMPGRSYNSSDYEYGFNGMRMDNEIKGTGNSYDFGARIYDPRIGRWLSVDPLAHMFSGWSPYPAFGDNPINNIDIDGRYFIGVNDKEVKFKQRKDGTLKVGRNASSNLKYLVNTVNTSGSKTAMNQIFEASQNKTKIHVNVESEVHDKVGQLGFEALGIHQAHDESGNALKWNEETGDFDGTPAYIEGEKGVYKEATITIFKGNIEESETKRINSGLNITNEQEVANTFQHESHHNTDKEFIQDLRNKREGKPYKGIDAHDNVHPQEEKVYNEMEKSNKKK